MPLTFEFILLLEFNPVFEDHFELFKEEIVGEPISAWAPLNEVVFVGGIFFNGPIQMDSVPGLLL